MSDHSAPHNKPFDPIRGRVFLQKKEPFAYPGETLHDHGQLAQFHPRTDPATEPPPPANNYYNVGYRDVSDLSSVAEDYASLSPMPAFRTSHEPGMYNGISWEFHVAQCHNMYYHDLEKEEGLIDSQAQSLLAMMSHGMGRSMTWLPTFYIPAHGYGSAYMTCSSEEFDGMVMGDGFFDYLCDRHIGTGLNFDYRERIWGKRWLVVPISFPPPPEHEYGHSVMSIFDRECGHLYLQDTAYGSCPLHRDERIQSAVHVWARFWNHMGLAHHFQYFVPTGTPQPYNFECGWLGVLWAMKNLRDQVGKQMRAEGPDVDPNLVWLRDVPIGNYEPENYPYENSSLYLCDWKPEHWSNHKKGVEHMRQVIYAMLANELGITETMKITGVEMAHRIDRITALMRVPGGIPFEDFWTRYGGPQFVIPRSWTKHRQPPKPYDPNATRRHHPPGYPFKNLNTKKPAIRNSPVSHNPGRPFNATFKGESFTREHPIVRRNHPPTLGTGRTFYIWEDARDGMWDHYVNVFNSQGTDENGREKGSWHNPPLRLQFTSEISEDRKSVRIKYRASFLGGDLNSEVGSFDIFLGGKIDETDVGDAPPHGYGYSTSETTNWSVSHSSASEDEKSDPKDSEDARKTPPGDHDGWLSPNLPEWSGYTLTSVGDSEPEKSQSESSSPGKRKAVEPVETLQQNQGREDKRSRSASPDNNRAASPGCAREQGPQTEDTTPGTLRRSSRVKKLTQLFDNMQRYS